MLHFKSIIHYKEGNAILYKFMQEYTNWSYTNYCVCNLMYIKGKKISFDFTCIYYFYKFTLIIYFLSFLILLNEKLHFIFCHTTYFYINLEKLDSFLAVYSYVYLAFHTSMCPYIPYFFVISLFIKLPLLFEEYLSPQ